MSRTERVNTVCVLEVESDVSWSCVSLLQQPQPMEWPADIKLLSIYWAEQVSCLTTNKYILFLLYLYLFTILPL